MDNSRERCDIALDLRPETLLSGVYSRAPRGQAIAGARRAGKCVLVRPGPAADGSEVHLSTLAIENPNRRDFLFLATGAVGAVGAAAVVWPLVDQMNPDASTLALASIEVDTGAIAEGQIVTVKWRGGPVFIRHRTKKEIDDAVNAPLSELKDPQTDAERVKKPEWLIVVGVCTHLGCVPLGHEGPYDGWKCPCHGSIYDTSGRSRSGPAPLNLAVPEYAFLSDTKVKIG
jgi:ubiquinol-cytochrome c reductase iron-sulfur subunit